MVEKFSDFEGLKYLDKAGEFEFTITDAELMDSKKGDPMVKFTLESTEGSTYVYHSLAPKARWSYNNLIRCALHIDNEKAKTFELDYFTIHQELIGKKVIGVAEEDSYVKEVKKPTAEGTFETVEETKISYKITSYKEA